MDPEVTFPSHRSRVGSFGFFEQQAKVRILNISVKALPSAGLVMKTVRPRRKTRKEIPRHTNWKSTEAASQSCRVTHAARSQHSVTHALRDPRSERETYRTSPVT
ncbi:hypothetical protein EYF80_020767 [Liparis tanakae]|uniref:Uncharacterized protein n=1 Tax=Liparis tanakae TaxID=230148 RepID=A0A4Z2HVM8_9TELE|nr:hypothetical protein EYF80_020767 [Liparis tanakae]